MSDSILLEVVTPERRIFSANVAELQFPTATNGYYGILPYHTPLVTPVGSGVIYFTQDDEKLCLTVFEGIAEVGPDHVTILARMAETMDMLDPETVQAEHQKALSLLKEAQTSEDQAKAQTLLDASLIRLQAKNLSQHH